MQWLKLHLSLARSPALVVCSLEARGLFWVLLETSEGGVVPVPGAATRDAFLMALAHDPSDSRAPLRAFAELEGHGIVATEGRTIVLKAAPRARALGSSPPTQPSNEIEKEEELNERPLTAAERKRRERESNPDRVAELNARRRARRHEKRDAKRDAIVTPNVTPRDAIVTPLRDATIAVVTPPLALRDGTDPWAALGAIETASKGRFSGRASGEQTARFVHLLVEHSATLEDCRDLGAVIASPPSWSTIKGTWTVPVLLGKPDSSGRRGGVLLTQLLGEVVSRRRRDASVTPARDASPTKRDASVTPRLAKVERPAFLNDPTPPPNATEVES